MNLNDWPITKTSGFVGGYVYTKKGVSLVDQSPNREERLRLDLADTYLDLWRRLNSIFDIHTMYVQTRNTCFVLSRSGNVIVQGGASLNLGLLFKDLTKLRKKPPITADLHDVEFEQRDQQVAWRILERIGRCEVSRCLKVDLGGETFDINASAKGFDLIADDKDLAAFLDLVKHAVKIGSEIRFTLGEIEKPVEPTYKVSDYLRAASGVLEHSADKWKFDASGWPIACPENVNFDQLNSVTKAVAALKENSENDATTKFTFFNRESEVVASVKSDDSGMSVSFVGDPPIK